MLAAVWVVDLLTPQLFVISILLNGPIALSSMTLDSRFTRVLVLVALAADASAGYANGVTDGSHWDAIAIGDRVIAALSFLLVGGLSIGTQRSAARAGELAARQDRLARERSVRRAVEAVRASINPELIERAIVREARIAFAVASARLYALRPAPGDLAGYVARADGDVDVVPGKPEPSIASFVQRLAAGATERLETGGATRFVNDDDPLSRLLLATLGATHAAAVPLVEHETVFGVLIVARDRAFEPHVEEALDYFATQAGIALAQAALFVQLAERNDELAGLNAAVNERSDVIRDIVYALSHDLRTPLVAARMTLQQARDGAFGELPAAYREILDRSIASNEELHRLAETLLLVSRYESGDRSTLREPVDLAAIARQAIVELEPLWRRKDLDVRLIHEGDSHVVAADKSEMLRALVNLLANAIAFTPPRGHVVLRASDAGGRARVAIEDDGYGVPEPERAHLFERLREAPGRQGSGSGLGLYLVRRIAESHAGRVSYAARPQGGSVFALEIPLLQAFVRA